MVAHRAPPQEALVGKVHEGPSTFVAGALVPWMLRLPSSRRRMRAPSGLRGPPFITPEGASLRSTMSACACHSGHSFLSATLCRPATPATICQRQCISRAAIDAGRQVSVGQSRLVQSFRPSQRGG